MRTSQNGDTPLLKTVQKLSHWGRNRILTVPTVTHLGSVYSVQFSSVAQSCPTLCDPMNCSTPGLPAVHGVTEGWTRLSDFTFTFHFHALEKEMATQSSVLAWRMPGTGEPCGLPSMGSHRVRHYWSDLAAAASLPVHHQLPEFTQTHVHRVSDAIQPSHPLSSPSPPAPNPSQHQSLFQWVNSSHEVAKVLEFQL